MVDHYFPFTDLPIELVLSILGFAADAALYRSLVLVSRCVHELAQAGCLPHMAIMLKSSRQVSSFHSLVTPAPAPATRWGASCRAEETARHVRHLWIIAAITLSEEKTKAAEIIMSCTNLVNLACREAALRSSILRPSSTSFKHVHCKRLTLMQDHYHVSCLGTFDLSPNGKKLFAQLTHLRIPGFVTASGGSGNEQPAEVELRFDNLTHFSYYGTPNDVGPFTIGSMTKLQMVVVTVPFLFGGCDDDGLVGQLRGDAVPGMIVANNATIVLHTLKRYDEYGIWRDAVESSRNLWQEAGKCVRRKEGPGAAAFVRM